MRPFKWDIFIDFIIKVLPYLSVTLIYVVGSIFFGFLIGLGIAMLRLSKKKVLRGIGSAYVTILRSVPSIVLLFIIYYGLPMLMQNKFSIDMSAVSTLVYVIVTFSLLLGSSMSEIIRTAYLSVPKGQYEAAKTLGMSYPQTMRRIILPQVIRIVLPPVSNETINLVKDTSLVYILAMNDLLRVARTIVQREFDMTPFLFAAIFYLAMTFVLTWGFKKLEAYYGKY